MAGSDTIRYRLRSKRTMSYAERPPRAMLIASVIGSAAIFPGSRGSPICRPRASVTRQKSAASLTRYSSAIAEIVAASPAMTEPGSMCARKTGSSAMRRVCFAANPARLSTRRSNAAFAACKSSADR